MTSYISMVVCYTSSMFVCLTKNTDYGIVYDKMNERRTKQPKECCLEKAILIHQFTFLVYIGNGFRFFFHILVWKMSPKISLWILYLKKVPSKIIVSWKSRKQIFLWLKCGEILKISIFGIYFLKASLSPIIAQSWKWSRGPNTYLLLRTPESVSYTHLTLPTIYSV